jgi:hypothetical protein
MRADGVVNACMADEAVGLGDQVRYLEGLEMFRQF